LTLERGKEAEGRLEGKVAASSSKMAFVLCLVCLYFDTT